MSGLPNVSWAELRAAFIVLRDGKAKNWTSRCCAAAAAAATSVYAATLRAEDVPQISVNWGQKVGLNLRFEQYAEVFIGWLKNWHVDTLSKT